MEDLPAKSGEEAGSGGRDETGPELTIVIPCLNEAETLAGMHRPGRRFLRAYEVAGEVVVADNGSTDGSTEIAQRAGARVVHVEQKGYGAALLGGIGAATGPYVAIGDADGSYDFMGLMPFVAKLRSGSDLVMGNRFLGGIGHGAMPRLHRYLGNPVLSLAGRLLPSFRHRRFSLRPARLSARGDPRPWPCRPRAWNMPPR